MRILKSKKKDSSFKYKPDKIVFYTDLKPKIPLVFFNRKNKNDKKLSD
jgi:hypothetical protein